MIHFPNSAQRFQPICFQRLKIKQNNVNRFPIKNFQCFRSAFHENNFIHGFLAHNICNGLTVCSFTVDRQNGPLHRLRLLQQVALILVNHLQHNIRNIGVKLRTFTFFDFCTHNFLWKGVAVASVAGHGVIRVRDADDPCDFRYFFAGKTVGVAFAVVAFMMVFGRHGNQAVFRNPAQNMVSRRRMDFYNVKLLVSQPTGFIDNIRRDADLAYVMQQTGAIDFFLLVLAFSHPFGDQIGILRHPRGMAAGISVLCVHRFAQRRNGLYKKTFQLLLLAANLLGLLSDLVFQFDLETLQLSGMARLFHVLFDNFINAAAYR